jgi:PAS domain S-box-containing protein
MMTISSRYLGFFKSAQKERHEIAEVRKTILDQLLYVFSLMGLVAVAVGTYQVYQQGRWAFAIIYVVIYLVFVLTTKASRQFSYTLRAFILVASLFLIALAILVRIGMSGVGLQLMLGVCFLACVLFGLRAGVLTIFVSLISIGFVAFGMTKGFIQIYPDHMLTSLSSVSWFTAICVFFMIVSITVVAPEMFTRRIKETLDLIETHRIRLETANQLLQKEVEGHKAAEEALRQANLVVENSPVVLFRWKATEGWPVEFVSANVVQFGYNPQNLLSGKVPYASLIYPEDLERVVKEVQGYSDAGADHFRQEYRIVTQEGDVRWVDDRTVIERDKAGQITHYQGTVFDISERRLAEDALHRSNRALRMLSECNEALVRAEEEGKLLNQTCRAIVDTGGYRLAWVGYAEESGEKIVRPVAQAGFEEGYLARRDIRWGDLEDDENPVGEAIRIGTSVAARRILSDPRLASWQDEARKLEYGSLIALPLMVEGRVAGSLNIYSAEPDAMDAEEVKFLEDLADDLAFGILAFRVSAERKKGEAALRESEELFEVFMDHLPAAAFMKDEQGQVLYSNRYLRELFGWTATGGKSTLDLLPQEVAERMVADDRAALAQGLITVSEQLKDAQGRERFFETQKFSIRIEGRPALLGGFSVDVTERKRAEERFRQVVEMAPYGIFLEVQGRFVYVNPAFLQLTGAERPEQLIGKSLLDCVPPDNRAQVAERIRMVNRDKKALSPIERKHIRLDGTTVDVEAVAAPFDVSGELGALAIIRDITERKQAEEALRLNEERYRLLLENAPVGIYVVTDEKITYANQAFARMLGARSPENLLGCDVLGYIHPDEHEAVRARRRLVYKERRAVPPLDERYIRVDGTILHVTAVAAPEPVRGSASVQVVVIDNTEKKRAEDELKAKTEELESYFTSALDLLCIADIDGTFHRLNREWEKLLGYRLDELEGRRFMDFVHPDDVQATLGALDDLKAQKEILSFTNRYRCKDGSYRFVEWRSIPVGKRIYAAARDMTERIWVEEELKRHRDHLEELVKARTRELEAAQEELIRRERLSVLGQLTATVSHELRNPLGVIRSSAFYVREKLKGGDEKAWKHINRIEKQVDLCDMIVSDLLEYTRGKHSQMAEMAVNPWLEKVLEEVDVSEGISLKRVFSQNLPMASFDPQKMGRAVINLVNNAIQAVTEKAEHGKGEEEEYIPQIRVRTSPGETGVLIEVEDNGTGMSEETAKRIFEPLFTTRARGTGLGLAIVKKIVEEHGGSVTLDTKPGLGSKVTVSIPWR